MELITTDREDAFGRLPTRMRFQISRCESVSLSCAWLLTFPTSLSLIVCWWVVFASTVGHYRAPRQRTHSMSLIRRRITFHPRHPNPSLTWGRCCGCFISRSLIRPPIQEADKRPPSGRKGGRNRAKNLPPVADPARAFRIRCQLDEQEKATERRLRPTSKKLLDGNDTPRRLAEQSQPPTV